MFFNYNPNQIFCQALKKIGTCLILKTNYLCNICYPTAFFFSELASYKMVPRKRKGESGEVSNYMTRKAAMYKLQLNLKDFR